MSGTTEAEANEFLDSLAFVGIKRYPGLDVQANRLFFGGVPSIPIDRDPYYKALHDYDPECPHCDPREGRKLP
jgi:hypothetical protein